jgi:hypothetical protein
MAENEAVLFANEAFYRAFCDGDLAAMDAVWASDVPVTCIHPGWNTLEGREAVMASWRAIMESANRPEISSVGGAAKVYGDSAVVTCYEAVGEGYLVATNIFVREAGAWKMVHHQAGPTPPPSLDASDGVPPAVH